MDVMTNQIYPQKAGHISALYDSNTRDIKWIASRTTSMMMVTSFQHRKCTSKIQIFKMTTAEIPFCQWVTTMKQLHSSHTWFVSFRRETICDALTQTGWKKFLSFFSVVHPTFSQDVSTKSGCHETSPPPTEMDNLVQTEVLKVYLGNWPLSLLIRNLDF